MRTPRTRNEPRRGSWRVWRTFHFHLFTHFRQAERLVEFPVGQKSCVGSNLAAQKLQLQTAVELNPKIPCSQGCGANCMPK